MTDAEFNSLPAMQRATTPVGGNGARAAAPVLTAAEAQDAIRHGVDQANGMKSPSVLSRDLPHSTKAEECLLSCCLLDGAATVGRCIEERIAPWSFFDKNCGLIFETIMRMHSARTPIDVVTLAEELRDRRTLEQVGGYAFITQISSLLPTTAQVDYFIIKVREHALLREIIRESASAIEECHAGSADIIDLGTSIVRRLEAVVGSHTASNRQQMDWDGLLAFDPKHDPDCLMGNRFLGRTGALVIVAPSGVGKSVLGFQLGACAALQRFFFSLRMLVPMRVLYVQAEDDFGDVAEAVQGFARGYNLTPAELALLKANLRIERWNDVTGDKFLTRLRRFHAVWPFDLVIINPLFAFAGCNISEAKELSPFLRNGLNPILNETRAAAVIIHHTNKPPQDPSAQDKAMDSELRYLGSGSAELTNWARAYITLQGVRAAGDHVHKMVFVKRGNRAGLVDAEGKPTHSIFVEHSKTGLCWLPSDYSPSLTGGKFQARFDLMKALAVYDSSKNWTANEIEIARDQGMTTRAVRGHRQEIEDRA